MKPTQLWKELKNLFLMAALVALVGCPSPTSGGGGGGGGGGGVSTPKIIQQVNGQVYASAFDSATNTLYIGGNFTEVSTPVPNPLVFNSSTSAIQSFPMVGGSVNTMAPDGSGGFYIGGNFNNVGGVPRNNLARVLANGTVDPNWDPNADGMVTKIVFGNSAVYVAGAFTIIGSQNRPGLAKLNPTTGAVDTNFNANASGTAILALAVDSTDLYVGGMFMSIDSQPRQNLARLNANTGAADSWNPSVTGAIVNDIVLTTSDVYIGGSFTLVGTTLANGFAKISKTNHSTVSAPSVVGNGVNDLELQGTTLYVGGDFTDFASSGIKYAVALNTSNDTVIATWNPDPLFVGNPSSTLVNSILVTPSTVYLVGTFTQVGSTPRNYVAAVNTTNGNPTSFTMNLNAQASKIAQSGSNIMITGGFDGRDPVVRNRLAAINVSTGQVTNWNPDLDSFVFALAIAGGKLYVGGQFTQVGTTPRQRLAAFNLSNGNLDTWNPGATGGTFGVRAIAIKDGNVIVGGDFTTVGTNNQTRTGLAIIDSTGAAQTWNPQLSGGTQGVVALAIDANTLYVGGDFTGVNTPNNRNRLASFNLSDGSLTNWNPDVTGTLVFSLAVSGGKVYVGGNFTQVGSTPRSHIAAVSASGTGSVDNTWYPTGGADQEVYGLAVSGSHLYVGGLFGTIGGTPRSRLAKLALSDGTVDSWNANVIASPVQFVASILPSGSTVYIGGEFMGAGSVPNIKLRKSILALNASTAAVQD